MGGHVAELRGRAGRRDGSVQGQADRRDGNVITMKRPAQRPDWMDKAAYERVPEELTVRELRLKVTQAGFRVRTMVLVTTLLDAQLYDKQELARAFRFRRHVELDPSQAQGKPFARSNRP